jgi:hypothetical protein
LSGIGRPLPFSDAFSPTPARRRLSSERAQRLTAEGESSVEEKDSAYRPRVGDVLDDEGASEYVPIGPFEDAEAA